MSYAPLRFLLIGTAIVMLAGCSWLGGSKGDNSAAVAYPAERSAQCEQNPRSCIYRGRYEAGEREYAELEAARLNRASLERLRQQAQR